MLQVFPLLHQIFFAQTFGFFIFITVFGGVNFLVFVFRRLIGLIIAVFSGLFGRGIGNHAFSGLFAGIVCPIIGGGLLRPAVLLGVGERLFGSVVVLSFSSGTLLSVFQGVPIRHQDFSVGNFTLYPVNFS